MAQVVLSRAALRDLDTILDHLTIEAGQRIADKYRGAMLRLFRLLGEHPGLGSPRPRLGRGVRMSVVAPYLVLYRSMGDTVAVLRVLHGRRKITATLLRRTR